MKSKKFPFHDGGGGAGLEGTLEVVNNYMKGVPHSKIEIHPFFKNEANYGKKSVIRKMDRT